MKNKRQEIVEVATDLVHSFGYGGASVQDIMRVAGIGKSQFYHYFSSKEDLGMAIVECYFARWQQKLIIEIFESDRAPKEKIEAMLEFVVEVHLQNQCRRGCFLGNLALELSEHNELFRLRLQQVFQVWTDQLTKILDEISQNEKLPIVLENQALAQVIVSMIEGGILMTKNSKSIYPLFNVTKTIRQMVNISEKVQ